MDRECVHAVVKAVVLVLTLVGLLGIPRWMLKEQVVTWLSR